MSTTHSRRSAPARRDGSRDLDPQPVEHLEPHAPDYGYLLALAVLVSVGLIMMYSTNAIGAELRALGRLGVGLALGLILAVIFAKLSPSALRTVSPYLLVASLLALGSLQVLGPPLVVARNGAVRWITLPGGVFTVQPSEYAKLALVLFSAGFLDRFGKRLLDGDGKTWTRFLGVLIVFCGLIYRQPDLGTTMVILGTVFCMLLAIGLDWKFLFMGIAIVAVAVGVLAWGSSYKRDRLLTYLNPWVYVKEGGYQVVQSWSAIARGGLTGVGLGQSTYKLNDRLPEAETDFIFAIVAEELGLLRALGVILLFGILVWRGYGIAARAPDRYTTLLASGITSWVAVQSCLNIAVVTGSVPNTGVPLPFISSGLSSLTALLAAAGVMVGISTRTRTGPAKGERNSAA